MIIIGERINTSRKAINEAMERRDEAFFQGEARGASPNLKSLIASKNL